MGDEIDLEIDFEKQIPRLPNDLKNILKISGYYNLESLNSFKSEDMEQLEKFGREELKSLIDESEYKDYFGVYHKAPEKYKLLPGYRRTLTKISEILTKTCHEKLNTNEEENRPRYQKNVKQEQMGSSKKSTTNNIKSQTIHDAMDLHKEKNDLKRELLKTTKCIIEGTDLHRSEKDNILNKLDNIEVNV